MTPTVLGNTSTWETVTLEKEDSAFSAMESLKQPKYINFCYLKMISVQVTSLFFFPELNTQT